MAYGDRQYGSSFGGFSFFPPVLKNIILINIGVFLLQNFFELFYFTSSIGEKIFLGQYIMEYFSLMPLNHGFLPWQLITYQFMHGGFTHILFNMLYLWMFGTEIENTVGSRKFLFFYLVSGVGAGLAQLFLSPVFSGGLAPTVGASGGVYGVLIAFAMMFPDRPIYIYFLLPIKAKYMIGFMVFMELFSVGSFSFVAHLAHLGGALTGFIFLMADDSFGFNYRFKKKVNNTFDTGHSSNSSTFYHWKGKSDNIIDVDFRESKSEHKNEPVNMDEVDRILDKITKYGYQSLSQEEKKKLYDASKNS